jgi:hypothetical protein
VLLREISSAKPKREAEIAQDVRPQQLLARDPARRLLRAPEYTSGRVGDVKVTEHRCRRTSMNFTLINGTTLADV